MSRLLRISEAAVLAVHTVALLGGREEVLTTREIAGFLAASEAHLSKVLQRLAKSGIVRSVRGPRGGFRLAGDAGEITLLEVYEAIDGPLEEGKCLLGAAVCDGECIMGEVLAQVDEIVRRQLSETKVCDVGAGLKGRDANAKKNNQDRPGPV